MNDFLTRLLSWLESLSHSASDALDLVRAVDPSLRMLVAGIAVVLQNFVVTGLFVPGNTLVFITASAVATPAEGVFLALAIAVGALLGEIASYGLGRWVSRSRWSVRWRSRHHGSRISAAHRFLVKLGGPAIFGARFVPLLRMVMPFAVGLSGFPFTRFVAWSAAASVAWSAIYVPLIALLSAPLRDKSGSLVMSVGLSLLGFVAFGAAYALQYAFEHARRRPESTKTAQPSEAVRKGIR